MTVNTANKVIGHVEIASKMLFRANVYFEAWWQSASVDGRRQFKNFWDEYWDFWRFNEHAMQFAFVVYIAGLYESRSDTVNFGSLWKETQSYASQPLQQRYRKALSSSQQTAQAVKILRSNAMAHRSTKLNYKQAFQKANVTPEQLRELIRCSWELLNIIEESLGQQPSEFQPTVVDSLRRLVSIESNRIASEIA